VDHYNSLQSGEPGTALALAEYMLRQRFPEHSGMIVSADAALRAG
jgi:hypothetical protein